MEDNIAIEALSALAQPTRLQAFRLLVKHEPEGLAAGDLARFCDAPANTMSTHLAILARARLIESERRGRTIIYRANIATVRDLVLYLVRDCCGGDASLCAPLIAGLTPCCDKAPDIA